MKLIICLLFILTSKNISARSTSDQLEEINIALLEHALSQANKLIWFELQNPVDPFIGRIEEINELKLGQTDGKMTVITGPRGIGKTELVKKYAQEIKHDNTTNILWLNARTTESLLNSFKDLAVHIGNSLENKVLTTVIRETFEFFDNRKSLFILDHALPDNVIIENLETLMGRTRKINIIVTSRDDDWKENGKIINLKPFTKDNAVEYLNIVLHKEINMRVVNSSAERVSELLKYLPLALSKASEYIIKKNTVIVEGEYTIDDYIKVLLKYQSSPGAIAIPAPEDIETEESIMDKIKQESDRIGKQIENEASNAWESISDESSRIGKQISNEADRTGRRISDEAARIESQVRNFFSFG